MVGTKEKRGMHLHKSDPHDVDGETVEDWQASLCWDGEVVGVLCSDTENMGKLLGALRDIEFMPNLTLALETEWRMFKRDNGGKGNE